MNCFSDSFLLVCSLSGGFRDPSLPPAHMQFGGYFGDLGQLQPQYAVPPDMHGHLQPQHTMFTAADLAQQANLQHAAAVFDLYDGLFPQ